MADAGGSEPRGSQVDTGTRRRCYLRPAHPKQRLDVLADATIGDVKHRGDMVHEELDEVARLDHAVRSAQAAVAERGSVAQRVDHARADRERRAAQLEVTEQLIAIDDADGSGVSGLMRRLFSKRDDLTRAEQNREAASLQAQVLRGELRAIDETIDRLEQRATALAGAEYALATALAHRVEHARAHANEETRARLIELGALDERVALQRRDTQEAIRAGEQTQQAFVAVQSAAATTRSVQRGAIAAMQVSNHIGLGLVPIGIAHDGMRAPLASAQQAMLQFQRECRDVAHGIPLDDIELPPLPGLVSLIARDMFVNDSVDDVTAEIDHLSSYVVSCVLELRARDRQLQRAHDALVAEELSLVSPSRDRIL